MVRLTASEPLAQEIVQDVFVKIWVNRAALMQVTHFRAYLFVVARNHAFNCLKQIARERTRKREWIQAVLHQASVPEEADAADRGHLLEKAVELLPAQQRKVYILSRQEGIRQAEIARKLNISHETVKKHMVLALRFLKNHLRTHAGMLILLMADFLEG